MTDDVSAQFTGTKALPAHLEFDQAKMGDYLRAHVDGFAGPYTVSQFRGGQSNPTFRIDARSGQYVVAASRPVTCCLPRTPSTVSFESCTPFTRWNFPFREPTACAKTSRCLAQSST